MGSQEKASQLLNENHKSETAAASGDGAILQEALGEGLWLPQLWCTLHPRQVLCLWGSRRFATHSHGSRSTWEGYAALLPGVGFVLWSYRFL